MSRKIHHAAVAGAALLAGCTAHTPAPPRPPAPHTAPPTPPETTTSTELAVPTTDVKPATTTVHIVATTRPRTRAPRPTAPATRAPTAATGDVADAIRAAFGSAGEKAVAVARCESGLRPGARNGPNYGVMQVNVVAHAARIRRMGYEPADLLTLGPNLAVAKAIYDEQGWRPWACA